MRESHRFWIHVLMANRCLTVCRPFPSQAVQQLISLSCAWCLGPKRFGRSWRKKQTVGLGSLVGSCHSNRLQPWSSLGLWKIASKLGCWQGSNTCALLWSFVGNSNHIQQISFDGGTISRQSYLSKRCCYISLSLAFSLRIGYLQVHLRYWQRWWICCLQFPTSIGTSQSSISKPLLAAWRWPNMSGWTGVEKGVVSCDGELMYSCLHIYIYKDIYIYIKIYIHIYIYKYQS